MKKQTQPKTPSKRYGHSPSDDGQAVRSAANKERNKQRAYRAACKAQQRKFTKGVVRGYARYEQRIVAVLAPLAQAEARRVEGERRAAEQAASMQAHRAVVVDIHNPITAEDLKAARAVLLYQRQQEIRKQDEQHRARLEARKARLNAQARN